MLPGSRRRAGGYSGMFPQPIARPIFVDARNGMAEADIYDFNKLSPGNVVIGPAVIHTPITTIVLQNKQSGTVDGYRNVLFDFDV